MSAGPIHARRTELGLEIAAVATQLRIPEQHLRAIEEGRITDLPRGPYARGWVLAYCEHLGVDPAPIVAAFEGSEAREKAPAAVPLSVVRVGATLTAVLLVGLIGWQLGALSDEPTNPGAGLQPEAAPQFDLVVRVQVERTGHIAAVVDGEQVFERATRPGEKHDFSGHNRVEVHLEAAENARVEYNGGLVIPQGRQDTPRRLVFIDDLDGD